MMKSFKVSRELHRLDMHIGRAFEKSACDSDWKDVTGSNGRIIQFLVEHDDRPIYQKDIEKAFGITRSTASRVLMLMEQKNLITRSGVDHDARLKQVRLTPLSLEISQAILERGSAIDEKLLAGFSSAEKQQLYSFMQRMMENIKNKD